MAIWQTRDRAGREVVLTDAGWAHVVGNHRDMVGRRDEVRAVVEAPDFVNRDALRADRENSYRRVRGRLYLKVCVEYDAAGEGAVITAHEMQRFKRGEQRIWP